MEHFALISLNLGLMLWKFKELKKPKLISHVLLGFRLH